MCVYTMARAGATAGKGKALALGRGAGVRDTCHWDAKA